MSEWLKINHTLVRSAKIRGLMRALRCKKASAVGTALLWLCWIDEQTEDGHTGLTADEMDEELGVRGAVAALVSIGWAAVDEAGAVYALEFGKHCGMSAKARAENARRVASCKARKRAASKAAQEQKEAAENRAEASGGAVPLPENADVVRVLMAGTASCALDRRELETCATVFFEKYAALGWTENGRAVRDWRALARAFMARWQNNLRSAGAAKGGNRETELNKNRYGNL